jgi:hypothetical protein
LAWPTEMTNTDTQHIMKFESPLSEVKEDLFQVWQRGARMRRTEKCLNQF